MDELPLPDLRLTRLEHRSMRVDAARLVDLVGAARPQHAERLHALVAWYAHYSRAIEDHHAAENDLIFPALLARDPSFGEADGELEEDHERLADQLAVTRLAVEGLAEAADSSRWERDKLEAIKATRALRALLSAHLDHEEAVAFPRFVSKFTAVELAALGQASRKRRGLRSLTFTGPWVLDHADSRERGQLLADQPRMLRALYHLAFRPRYEHLVGQLDDSSPSR